MRGLFPAHARRSGVRAITALAIAVALGVLAPRLASGQGFPLGVRVDFAAGDVNDVAVADLNGDHVSDLLGVNLNGATLSVWLGTGGGAFGVRTDFAVPGQPFWLAVGDLNGDGKPDVVTANGNGTVSVLLGNGAGGFATHVDYVAGAGGSYFVALGDLNGDGKLDVVTSNFHANSVSVLLGQGDGTFAAKSDVTVGTAPNQVALGDVNNDGFQDIVVEDYHDADVSVLLGNGSGGFDPRVTHATHAGPVGLVLTDLNHDGKLDIATCNDSLNDVSVLLGDGTGAFGAATPYGTSPYVAGIAAGDVTGDGSPDLVISGGAPTNVISVLPGNGAGGFGAHMDVAVGNGPAGLTIGDLNGDGRADILVADFNAHLVSLLLAAPITGALLAQSTSAATGWVAMADVNGDSLADLAATNTGGNAVMVDLATRTGFGGWTPYPAASGPGSVAIVDVDANPGADLFVTNSDNTVSTFPNQGGGVFGPHSEGPTSHGQAYGAEAVRFDASSSGPVALEQNGYAAFFNGTSDFLDDQTGFLPAQVATGDLDGDGLVDLVTGNSINVTVVRPALSIPEQRTDVTPPGGGGPFGVAVGDLNGDGKADLAVVRASGGVLVYAGTASGVSGTPATYPTLTPQGNAAPPWIQMLDLNGDGRLDMIVSMRTDSAQVVIGVYSEFLGDGAGGFGPRIDVHGASDGSQFASGDVNGDGRSDIANAASTILLTPSPTRTVLGAAPAQTTQGSSITLTATVQPTRIIPAAPTVGTVSFFDGTTLLGTAPVSWTTHVGTCGFPGCFIPPTVYTGTATLSPTMNHPGARLLTAVYSGDGRRAGSFAAAIPVQVQRTIAVPAAVAASFALAPESNPAIGGRLRVAFTLPTAAPATLELFDLAGRRVARWDVGAHGAGRHELELAARSIPSGVYFVRLAQGPNAATARIALLD